VRWQVEALLLQWQPQQQQRRRRRRRRRQHRQQQPLLTHSCQQCWPQQVTLCLQQSALAPLVLLVLMVLMVLLQQQLLLLFCRLPPLQLREPMAGPQHLCWAPRQLAAAANLAPAARCATRPPYCLCRHPRPQKLQALQLAGLHAPFQSCRAMT
jgi:hypothetical protein